MEHQEPAKKKRRRPRRRPRVQKPRPLSGNIVLCGFMGCGKSSVGRRVAKLLERQFCDLDSYIEQQAGMTVAEIFAKEGGGGLPRPGDPSRGGGGRPKGYGHRQRGRHGAVPRNVEAFHKHGAHILFLDVPVAALQERLKNDKRRPLLQVPDRRKVIAELYEKRVPLYRAAADITVDGGAPAVVVAKRVAALFQ